MVQISILLLLYKRLYTIAIFSWYAKGSLILYMLWWWTDGNIQWPFLVAVENNIRKSIFVVVQKFLFFNAHKIVPLLYRRLIHMYIVKHVVPVQTFIFLLMYKRSFLNKIIKHNIQMQSWKWNKYILCKEVSPVLYFYSKGKINTKQYLLEDTTVIFRWCC